jgi:hypothetical protein
MTSRGASDGRATWHTDQDVKSGARGTPGGNDVDDLPLGQQYYEREYAMPIDAALDSGTKTYFFNGSQYIRVTRGDTGPGTVDPGYPAKISAWGWPADFGNDGIDAAFRSGPKCYFVSGSRYIRVTRGDSGPGTVDPGYPKYIDTWGWPFRWASDGIDAAFRRGDKTYFFADGHYIRVTRGDTGPGTVDPGYAKHISEWHWPDGFATDGIDAAHHSYGWSTSTSGLRRSRTYFFSGNRFIISRAVTPVPGPLTLGPRTTSRHWA